jgi:hypothetical protein
MLLNPELNQSPVPLLLFNIDEPWEDLKLEPGMLVRSRPGMAYLYMEEPYKRIVSLKNKFTSESKDKTIAETLLNGLLFYTCSDSVLQVNSIYTVKSSAVRAIVCTLCENTAESSSANQPNLASSCVTSSEITDITSSTRFKNELSSTEGTPITKKYELYEVGTSLYLKFRVPEVVFTKLLLDASSVYDYYVYDGFYYVDVSELMWSYVKMALNHQNQHQMLRRV